MYNSLRPRDDSIVIRVDSVNGFSGCYRQMERCFSKKEGREPEIVYVEALGKTIPIAVSVTELLKRDFGVNVVYTGIGTYLTEDKTRKNPDGCISRIVIGVSKKNQEPQYETFETETLNIKKSK